MAYPWSERTADCRWSDDWWAQRWTSGLLQPDKEGPLPWWLSGHTSSYAFNVVIATTHPQLMSLTRALDECAWMPLLD